MCWNWEVSISFTIWLSLGALFIYKRGSLGFKSTPRDKWDSLLVFNLACVQFWEFLIWMVVYPRDADSNLCPTANTAFTVMVYFHGVLAWPPITNMLAYKTTTGRREYLAFPLFYGFVYTFFGIADLVYTYLYMPWVPRTCGLDGRTNLQWQVALSQSRILPGGYDWFVFTVYPFLFYTPRPIGFFMLGYLFLTFMIPYILLSLGEAASVFCWLGFGICLVYFVEPYVIHFFKTNYPNVMTWDPAAPILAKLDKFLNGKASLINPTITEDVDVDVDDLDMDEDKAARTPLNLSVMTVETELTNSRESNATDLNP